MATKLEISTAKSFVHKTVKNADGSAMRCRASGKFQTWKTRPNEFKLPVKYGLYNSFYITEANADDWNVA